MVIGVFGPGAFSRRRYAVGVHERNRWLVDRSRIFIPVTIVDAVYFDAKTSSRQVLPCMGLRGDEERLPQAFVIREEKR